MRVKKAPKLCVEYENGVRCTKALWIYGRCFNHFKKLDPRLFARLKSMTRKQRAEEFEKVAGVPAFPRWMFENPQGEAQLAAECERLEKKAREGKNNEQ